MKYTDLNATQKRAVDAFITLRPELKTANTITRTEIEELFFILYDARANGGVKIGYPGWLIRGEKVSRGVYPFPGPEATSAPTIQPVQNKARSSAKTVASVKPVDTSKVEEEFLQDLADCGIITENTETV
jgi:hypothetical protein